MSNDTGENFVWLLAGVGLGAGLVGLWTMVTQTPGATVTEFVRDGDGRIIEILERST